MTHFLWAWRISSQSPNLQECRCQGPRTYKWIVYKGAGYLKFMLQSRIKVDKPFLYCHHREEKDKWILMALYLFLHISPEKRFSQSYYLCQINPQRDTAVPLNLCKILPWCSKKKNDSVWYVLLFFWIIWGVVHEIFWSASVPEPVLEIKLSN